MTDQARPATRPSPDLTILETRVYRGANVWSYDKAIHLVVDLGSLRCAMSVDLGFAPVDRAYAAAFEAKARAFGGLFRSCDTATPDVGEADRSFEVIRAVNFVGRWQETYERDPSQLGRASLLRSEDGFFLKLSYLFQM